MIRYLFASASFFRPSSPFNSVALAWVFISIVAYPARASEDLQQGEPIPKLTLTTLAKDHIDTSDPHPPITLYLFGQNDHEQTQKACRVIDKVLKDPMLEGVNVRWIFILSKGSDPTAPDPCADDPKNTPKHTPIMVYDDSREAFGAFHIFTIPAIVIADQQASVVHFIPTMLPRFDDRIRAALLFAAKKYTPEEFEQSIHPIPEQKVNNQTRAQRHLNLARHALASGLDEIAITQYIQTLELDEQLVQARIGLGFLLLRQMKTEKAQQIFESILETNPENSDARLGLATTLIQMGDEHLEKAETMIRNVIQQDPENARAIYTLGFWYEAQHQSEQALEHYKKAAQLLLNATDPDQQIITK